MLRLEPLELDPASLRVTASAMLAAGVALPLLPGEAGVPCPLRTLTGIPCPLCGMTTSVVATDHLDLADAIAANPGGVVVVVVALAMFVRRRVVLIPAAAAYLALVALWVYELHRFAVV